ncbi:ABC transporter transmembrane domain-containing protein [Pontivivens insulae]|uniref:Lipid A export ATP-binding/permease protein MsbA n=1 Tax=Pontivivens insulae TaxID=1639689 RepID=A0A2R8ABM9_9RHOB|nr:ABC transporter transmembrane domain-containing protein [Pontivivens insulae]RED11180.1 ATP-binding cassette subfamily B protein [Pontivivens insulae]SPF29646.1 Lipid A export ATP-binding/permease protein MsbA [Pontivivens insulae]
MTEITEDRARATRLSPIRGLAPFLAPYKLWIAGAALALIFTASLTLVLPIAVRRVVDSFLADDLGVVDSYFAAALGIVALLAIGTALRYMIVTLIGERVVADIRKAVYDKVIGMSPVFYERLMTGEVLSRLTTDTTLILSVVSSSISVALRNVLTFMGGLVLMLLTSPKLTMAVLVLVPLVILPIVVMGRRLRVLSRENQDRIAGSSAMASETLMAAQTVQAYTHEAVSRGGFGDLTEGAYDSSRRRIRVRAIMTAIVIFLVFTGVIGVLWLGVRDVRAETMSPGTLVQFLIYAILVAGAVGALSEIWGELMRAAGATERLVELLDAEDPIRDDGTAIYVPGAGSVAIRDASFRYPARPTVPALEEVSLEVRAGETVAIVGPSGAGKSTIFQLLLRFYDPDAGQIELDGVNIRDLPREQMRRAFALVPQEPVIFAASARENIRFGRPDATDAEVEAAARAAAAHDFLTALPDGYDTYVGERGVMLSGGQKQRIAIARAILRDAPVLLLDEATSALDAESERAVQAAVEDLSKDRTTLVIAHRLATVKKADRIIVMEGGRIVASGTHDSLVAEGGLYARLARLQFTADMDAA